MKIDWMDVEELAAKLCGMDEEYDSDDVESRLYEKFEVSFDSFHKIVEALAPMALRGITREKIINDCKSGDSNP